MSNDEARRMLAFARSLEAEARDLAISRKQIDRLIAAENYAGARCIRYAIRLALGINPERY